MYVRVCDGSKRSTKREESAQYEMRKKYLKKGEIIIIIIYNKYMIEHIYKRGLTRRTHITNHETFISHFPKHHNTSIYQFLKFTKLDQLGRRIERFV